MKSSSSLRGRATVKASTFLCVQAASGTVGGWLRVACSYMERVACSGKWDGEVPHAVRGMLQEGLERVSAGDPMKGWWCVQGGARAVVWCDASSHTEGVCLEVGGHIVDDAGWLRKENDGACKRMPPPGFEPGSPNSGAGMITTTPWRPTHPKGHKYRLYYTCH